MRDWKKWLRAALIRAIKSMSEGALAVIGSAFFVKDVNWLAVLSGAVIAGITSMLISLKGIPEEQNIEVYFDSEGVPDLSDDSESKLPYEND